MTPIGEAIPVLLSLLLLSAATVSDLKSLRIPNSWICAGLAAGLFLRALPWTEPGWGGVFSGLLIPLLICWIPFRMGAMGAGDVKLLTALGVLNGGRTIFYCIFFSFLFAAGISLFRLLRLRCLRDSLIQSFSYFQTIFLSGKIEVYPGRHAEGHTIRFAVAILIGYAVWVGGSLCRSLR